MKALTILQPFAELIVADANTLPPHQSPKRIENRNWPTDFRGDFVIHAGKSTNLLFGTNWPTSEYAVTLGAAVGIATLADCIAIERIKARDPVIEQRFPWLFDHPHAIGRYCFVLEHVRRFVTPIAIVGKLGWWEVRDDLITSKAVKVTQ